jgi:hypothetical protein
MRGALVSAGAYAAAAALGFAVDVRVALFVVMALQVTWTPFCLIRCVQLRRSDREGCAFAAGGLVSSIGLLFVSVVLSQVV